MVDAKITALAENTAPISTDLIAVVDDPAGSPATQKCSVANFLAVYDARTSTLTNKTLDVEDATNVLKQTTPASGEYLRDNGTKFVSSAILAGDLPTGIDATKIGGGGVTSAEFDYLGGVTSDVQTQINTNNPIGIHDLFIPAGAMWARTTNGAGGLTKVETGTNKINYQTWEFDTTTQEYVQFSWIPPRNYNNGTVKFTFWWTNAAGLTTETVDWNVAGVAFSNDDPLDTAMGTAVTTTDTWIAQNDVHISPQSTAVTIAGTPADADFIMFEISRKVSTDNLTGDARLIGVVLEYTIDSAKSA